MHISNLYLFLINVFICVLKHGAFILDPTVALEVRNVIRLVGPSKYEGRVEVNVNGTWGTVCDDNWGLYDGYVVCKELGFHGVNSVYSGAHYGEGTGPIFHDDLDCTALENSLNQCTGIHDPLLVDCLHAEDAGVRCQPPAHKTGDGDCNHHDSFTCSVSKTCIPKQWMCDGHQDCNDGTDELPLLCKPQNYCGIQSTEPTARRIVGGRDAKVGSWPWIASLKVTMSTSVMHSQPVLCGGTLVDRQWVLTAAHCFDHFKASSSTFQVVLGDYDMHVDESTEQTINVSHVYIHTRYVRSTHLNDVALIKLAHPVDMSHGHANVACLPTTGVPAFGHGDGCYVAGFGETRGTGNSDVLQEAIVPIIDTTACNHWYNHTVKAGMMCAGYQFGGIDACKGDSGGPLSCKRDGHWYVAGIVSWGDGCAKVQHPGIYMNVSHYVRWIAHVIHIQDNKTQHAFNADMMVG